MGILNKYTIYYIVIDGVNEKIIEEGYYTSLSNIAIIKAASSKAGNNLFEFYSKNEAIAWKKRWEVGITSID